MLQRIALPESKSILIRRLLSHFVRTGEVLAVADDVCTDVRVTHEGLRQIAAHCDGACAERISIDVRDCGAACRFFLALLSATPGQWLLTGTPRLLQRPMAELIAPLRTAGAQIRQVTAGWQIDGQHLHAPMLTVDASRSSQFVSALLLMAERIGLEELRLQPMEMGSLSYIQLTRAITGTAVRLPGIPDVVPDVGRTGDWSAAIFWYAYLCLHPERTFLLENISLSSAQGDSRIARWFERLGVRSEETPEGCRISMRMEPVRKPWALDVADCPDTVPVMAALACCLPLDITFQHTRKLRFKESDRLQALSQGLQPFADICKGDDTLRVVGRPQSQWPHDRVEVDTCRDHRLAMAFLLLGDAVRLNDVRCLDKSYPKLLVQLLR